MTTSKPLTYTKKINNGVLRLSEMEVGASVVGTVMEATIGGQYNTGILSLQLPGNKEVKVYLSGNLNKFFDQDLNTNKYQIGRTIVITRQENKTFNSVKNGTISVGQFTVRGLDNTSVASTPATKKTRQQELQEELSAARK